MMMANNTVVEGNPAAPITTVGSQKINHGFLDDIAHAANPSVPGYNQALLEAHFVTGDGRGNENIALTSVHTVFHAEHNRLREYFDVSINDPAFGLTAAERAAWHAQAAQPPAGSGWGYGERLFQAARFATEMQYQHLVFEEFARKISPSINAFIGDGINFVANINPAISAEFAHQVYRLGHSMLTETIDRVNTDGSANNISLLDAFLNPLAFNNGGPAGPLTAAQAAGSVFTGMTRQVGNEIDEFVTEAVRSRLVGLPLDLAVLNIARGRSEGVASLNSVRRQLFQQSGDFALVPYDSWFDFGFGIKHGESLVNFIAAYGQHPTLTDPASPAAPLTVAQRRAAAQALLSDANFLFAPASQSGVDDIDLWMGGLAEKQTPFGGLLGTTFNYVFEIQLENLQNADRFYYLERLDGLNFLSQLEANSFVELVQRNTTLNGAAGADVFARPDLVITLSFQPLTGPTVDDPSTPDFDESVELIRMPNGTIRYAGPAHVIWNGRNDGNSDRIFSSEGDDTLRGNGGNDVMEGGAGNDQHIGGAGDDILTDVFGDDVMKGGPGNDAISGGAGPFDLLQGNEGNDFIVAGPDESEIFGGPGQDVFYMGKGLSESIGGAGDDWIEGTESPASIAIGDDNNQFQNDPNGGHDIAVAGLGDMDFDMEGGDDIMVGNVIPTHRFEGMLGFDWATYRGETQRVDADMLVTGATAVNAPLNENRDRYDLIEGLSGTDFNDLLFGDDRTAADLADDGLTGVPNGHVLNAAGIARITGLAAILPPGATTWGDGNIILGGPGSDLIEGRGGDDIIDGDRWLNVQLMAPNPAGGPALLANSLHELKAAVFAGQINPGSITFVRSIVTTGTGGTDTAVFTGPRADYTVTVVGNVVTVTDNVGTDGVDTLRNIERLQFADVNVASGAGTASVALANVVNQLQANAIATLAGQGLGFALATANSGTIAAGRVISQTPVAGTQVNVGSTIGLVISLGPVTVVVPNVVGSTQAGATTALTGLGLTVSTTTANSATVPFGSVISQTPIAGATAIVPSNVALVISAGVSNGLIAAFGFEEQTGTVAIDSSPLPRNGTVAGGAVRVATGKIGRAIQFDGVNDSVNIIDGAAGTKLDLTTGMTIEAWVNPSAAAGWETVVYKERGAAGTGLLSYALYSHDGAPQGGGTAGPAAYIRIGTVDQAVRRTPAATLPLNVWTHLAATYNGVRYQLYVNGVMVTDRAQTGAMLVGNQPLRIGASNALISEFFNGLIDEVRIYNRALTVTEINADMTAPVVQ
jgi:Ca2+-binding RTX toxin-like protein